MTPNRTDRGPATPTELVLVAVILIAIVLGAVLVVDSSRIAFNAVPEAPLRALVP